MMPEEQPQPEQPEPALQASENVPPPPPTNENFEIPKKDGGSKLERLKHWYTANKKLSIPLTVLLLLLILAAVPFTRYKVAGLVLKNDYSVKVIDATAGTPVSGATVSAGSVSGQTDGSGNVTLHGVKVGSHTISLSKKYYQSKSASELVPILKQKSTPQIALTATGRQVEVDITNLINKQALSNVNIEVADITGKTDKDGKALLVVPANLASAKATLSLDGYNKASVTIQVSDTSTKKNAYTLTPAGKVYFLSKLSGKIDVVKTNLDGTERATVIGGTGKEDDANTVLLASRDWQYLALLSKRDSDLAKLYVINTNDDKLLTMDEGDATFIPVGWYNHYFIYKVARNGYNSWQPNAVSIKSYNAETGQLITLANSNASGSSNADAQYEAIWDTIIMGNDIVFTRTWYQYPGYLSVSGKQDVLAAIHADGTSSRQLKTVDASDLYFSNLKLNKPRELDFGVYSNSGAATTYFVLDKSGNITQSSTLTDQDLAAEVKTYLASPSNIQTFWQEERDGKNTLFVGDQDAGGAKQIASLSDYNTYGWYSDNYLLVAKNASELYIIPVSGIKKDSDALKITDYHKPAQNFYGYGGGYGGL